jgi:hypothetical protein
MRLEAATGAGRRHLSAHEQVPSEKVFEAIRNFASRALLRRLRELHTHDLHLNRGSLTPYAIERPTHGQHSNGLPNMPDTNSAC